MGTTTVRTTCHKRHPRRAYPVEDFDLDRDDPTHFGLTTVGPRVTRDRAVDGVVRIVRDWGWMLGERQVALSAVMLALSSDIQSRDLAILDGLYTSQDGYTVAAWWHLRYVLNHLDGSGLAVVRLSR